MNDTPDHPDADGTEPSMLIDYPRMVQRALRTVVRDALALVAEEGLPGEHHFLIEFATTAPDVVMPSHLRLDHPETIRIVLQHQFWNLEVWEDAFAVDLRFGGRLSRLEVPFDAVVSFVDPAAQISLGFTYEDQDQDEELPDAADDEATDDDDVEGRVVSLDAFRRNR